MADQSLRFRSDDELEAALRGLADEIGWPVASTPSGDAPDIAATVRARIETAPPAQGRYGLGPDRGAGLPRRPRWNWWPARRALVAAILILLALAVIAGAAGLGLPGLRLILGPAPVSPPPSVAPTIEPSASGGAGALPGSTLGLGEPVAFDQLDARAGFKVAWPSDPAVGAPDSAYVDASLGNQVALVWRSRDGLPDTLKPGVGLVLTEFRGSLDSGFFSKAIGSGTTATPVLVHGGRAFWVSGDPHFLFYTGPNGFVHEDRRWIGDALIWAHGPITYRLETSIGRAEAIRIAESMP